MLSELQIKEALLHYLWKVDSLLENVMHFHRLETNNGKFSYFLLGNVVDLIAI